MPIICDPNDLARASACYCYDHKTADAVIAYLLAQIAGDTSTPAELARKAACYCLPPKESEAVKAFLLCAIANAGGSGGGSAQSGAGSPVGVATPDFIGQLYHDTTADAYYRSTGLTNADWVVIGGSDPANLVFPYMVMGALNFVVYDTVVTISFPNLTDVDDGNFLIFDPVLTSIYVPNMANTAGSLSVTGCELLTSVSLPSIITISGDCNLNGDTVLSSFSAPLWVPTDGTNITFIGDALDATSLELILRRCVLAGVTTCSIDLSGGTNASLASLSAQGQTDYATLVTAGNTMAINP